MTSPWKDYPPPVSDDTAGQPDTSPAASPAPQRWLAVLIVLAVVCAIVMVMG